MSVQKYDERESKILEFKSTVKSLEGITKTAIAYANGVGGKIVIGVDDKTREIVGISDALRDRIYDDFPNSLYDSTSPNLISQIYEQRIGQKEVLIIEIYPSNKKPCFLRSKGIPKGVYLRVGSSTRVANEDYVEELLRESQRISYDETLIYKDLNVFSESLLKEYYKKRSTEKLLEDKIIGRLSANQEVLHPTVAGVLLFSDRPDKYLPEAHVICTRFAGTEGREIIQTEEIKGSISEQIDTCYRLVKSWIKRDYKLKETRLVSRTLIPEVALREVITNALVHRKYTIHGATKIALYDNRLEIFSPGNFPGHVSVNNLGEGITHLRNPVIGRMAHKMGIIEKLGSGIKLILDSCRKAKVAPPIFSEDGDYVKVVFEFKPAKDERKHSYEILIDYFRDKPTLTMKEIIDYLGVSKNTAFKIVRTLTAQDLVKQVGKGRNSRYTLK